MWAGLAAVVGDAAERSNASVSVPVPSAAFGLQHAVNAAGSPRVGRPDPAVFFSASKA